MNRWKTLSASALILMMATTACTGGNNTTSEGGNQPTSNTGGGEVSQSEPVDPFGKYEQPVELSIGKGIIAEPQFPEGETWSDNEYYRHLASTLNINIKHAWEADSSGKAYEDKINLSIASNNLPDAFSLIGSQAKQQLREMVKNGMLEDLTEVYEQWISPEYKTIIDSTGGKALEEVTVDGKIYAIPTAKEVTPNLIWVRQDWLDELKLQAPKTVEDVFSIAKAFKEADPDKTGKAIGLTGVEKFFSTGNEMHGYDPIFNAFHAYAAQWTKDDSGQIAYGGIQPETKAALERITQAFKDGLIDKEFATKDAGKANEELTSGRSGIAFLPWWTPGWPLQDSIKNTKGKAVWKAYPLLDGEGNFNGQQTGILNSIYVVKKGYEHPEALAKVINWEFKIKSRGYSELNELMDTGSYKDIKRRGTPLEVNIARMDEIQFIGDLVQQGIDGKLTKEEIDKMHPEAWVKVENANKNRANANPVDDPGAWSDDTSWTVGAPALVAAPQKVHFNEFDGITKAMEQKWQILSDLQMQAFLKIIYGEQPIDYFDQFVSQWKSQGGDQITEEIGTLMK